MSVTPETSHEERSELKKVALRGILDMSVTSAYPPVRLTACAAVLRNIPDMSVTPETSHEERSELKAYVLANM